MKYTSNPCHAKINSAKGRKPTSYPRLLQAIRFRFDWLLKHAGTRTTDHPPLLPACLSKTILVYAKNHLGQNRVQIPLTPTPPPQTPMFSRFAVLYQIIITTAQSIATHKWQSAARHNYTCTHLCDFTTQFSLLIPYGTLFAIRCMKGGDYNGLPDIMPKNFKRRCNSCQ